ncbi:MAG: 16S rRNA (uracil(1498)-N(3))-methyltransferase [Bacteroidaceae bacterium]|jgi:16S rRNA (uracil1498-N3)-methyltransferase|nr:16S rRNA (uracil(1498)-N(3))-methyltransferase [Bacteroidaceae bacterium]
MWLFYTPDIQDDMQLPEEEAGHCIRVLRMKEGDRIRLTDGKGSFYDAVISAVSGKRCMVHIESREVQQPLWDGHLHIAVAPTKLMDRNEWFVEKAVEIGVDEITFLKTDHSERDVVKMERIEKIAVSAMKQSQKATLPVLNGMTTLRNLIERGFDGDKFIAHCEPGSKVLLQDAVIPGHDSLVLIGPEGDFSPAEIEMALKAGFRPISLGPSRLRTETAALVAVHIMNLAGQRRE